MATIPIFMSSRSRTAAMPAYIYALAGFFVVISWSLHQTKDGPTWVLESLPVIVGFILAVATYQRYPLTPLSYITLFIGAVFILVGAHYTYAEMPLFNWIRDYYGLSRNYYDRVGHFVQGFVTAVFIREVLLRWSPLTTGKWLFMIVISISLAEAALYELAEWVTSISLGKTASEFLGLQGDEWDAQKDMTLALLGAMVAQWVLNPYHDKQLRRHGFY